MPLLSRLFYSMLFVTQYLGCRVQILGVGSLRDNLLLNCRFVMDVWYDLNAPPERAGVLMITQRFAFYTNSNFA